MPEALITTQLGQPHVLFLDNGDPGRSGMFVWPGTIVLKHVTYMYCMQRIHGKIH